MENVIIDPAKFASVGADMQNRFDKFTGGLAASHPTLVETSMPVPPVMDIGRLQQESFVLRRLATTPSTSVWSEPVGSEAGIVYLKRAKFYRLETWSAEFVATAACAYHFWTHASYYDQNGTFTPIAIQSSFQNFASGTTIVINEGVNLTKPQLGPTLTFSDQASDEILVQTVDNFQVVAQRFSGAGFLSMNEINLVFTLYY